MQPKLAEKIINFHENARHSEVLN
uniref:Uncharacterized protein n=1 Tax=Nelumbo nucifera TaxID=4432 RepID=A0A822ZMS3_NELNU|nr:TPA_asm: hypothetical protein HUJ06_003005 [Nelumbo nucifera]